MQVQGVSSQVNNVSQSTEKVSPEVSSEVRELQVQEVSGQDNNVNQEGSPGSQGASQGASLGSKSQVGQVSKGLSTLKQSTLNWHRTEDPRPVFPLNIKKETSPIEELTSSKTEPSLKTSEN